MAKVEARHGDAGFVYVGDTRLIFAPDVQNNELLLLSSTRWGRPSAREWAEAKDALQVAFPNHKIAP